MQISYPIKVSTAMPAQTSIQLFTDLSFYLIKISIQLGGKALKIDVYIHKRSVISWTKFLIFHYFHDLLLFVV